MRKIPEITICPYCKKKPLWVPNEIIYGKRYGKSYMCYYCIACDAYVGCHNNTQKPLGTMANKELRKYRMATHRVFDSLWKSKNITRDAAYKILNKHFNKEMHIGESDIETCKEIIKFITMG